MPLSFLVFLKSTELLATTGSRTTQLCRTRSASNATPFVQICSDHFAQVQAKELEVGSEVILDGTQAQLTSMESCLSFRTPLPSSFFLMFFPPRFMLSYLFILFLHVLACFGFLHDPGNDFQQAEEWKVKPTMVLKISFRPDLPVAAFMRPPAIMSKGSRKRQFRRGKKRDGGDAVTIPDTERYPTD